MFRTIERYEENGLGLPYPIILKNAAEELLDTEGNVIGTRVPDLEGLSAAVAVTRCLEAPALSGEEVRFIRRVLGMTQKQLAAAMEMKSHETISRWENNVQGAVGGYGEKLLRTLALLQLKSRTPGLAVAASDIVHLKIVPRRHTHRQVTAERVRVSDGGTKAGDAWDVPLLNAA